MAKFSPEKIAGMKAIGFTDEDIAGFSAQATSTEKAATDQGVAFKAEPPTVHILDSTGSAGYQPGERFKAANGTEYIKSPSELDPTGIYYASAVKAFPPPKADAAPAVDETVVEEDAIDEMPIEEDVGGLTLSPEDIAAIGSAVAEQIGPAIAQVMGALDLEKKVAGHVQGMLAPFQAQKDASDAEKAEQIATLQASLKSTEEKLNELLGLQPAVTPRASAAPTTALNPFNPADNALLQAVKEQVPLDQQGYVNGFEDLTKNLFGR